MQTRYLRSIQQNEKPKAQSFEADGQLLNQKIAYITNLVNSLNAAVEDLEAVEVPPLDDQFDFYREVERFEIGLIKSALRLSGGSQVKAAKLLNLNATTLNAKIKTFKLSLKSSGDL